jgi:hypothetical protein
MMPLGIVHPIETGHLFRVHGSEGVVRRQRSIIERSCVIRRLRPMLLFAFGSLAFRALIIIGGGVIHFFIRG